MWLPIMDQIDAAGRDAFWLAAQQGDEKVLAALWDSRLQGWMPQVADANGRTALHAAIMWQQSATLRFMLRRMDAAVVKQHMHPQLRKDRWAKSAVMYAREHEDLEEMLHAWMYRNGLSMTQE